MNAITIPVRVAERAATRYEVDANGCHVSTYSRGSHGYAQIGWWAGGKSHMTTAHRAAFKHYTGNEPETVDHICHNRACVRIDHLRALSNLENARRNAPGRDYPLGWTCIRNHDAPRNTKGNCVECVRESGRRAMRKHRRKAF